MILGPVLPWRYSPMVDLLAWIARGTGADAGVLVAARVVVLAATRASFGKAQAVGPFSRTNKQVVARRIARYRRKLMTALRVLQTLGLKKGTKKSDCRSSRVPCAIDRRSCNSLPRESACGNLVSAWMLAAEVKLSDRLSFCLMTATSANPHYSRFQLPLIKETKLPSQLQILFRKI